MPPYTRRELGKLALAGLPATASLLELSPAFAAPSAKPNSTWAGVQVGMNVPYNFGTRTTMSAEEVSRNSSTSKATDRCAVQSQPAGYGGKGQPLSQ